MATRRQPTCIACLPSTTCTKLIFVIAITKHISNLHFSLISISSSTTTYQFRNPCKRTSYLCCYGSCKRYCTSLIGLCNNYIIYRKIVRTCIIIQVSKSQLYSSSTTRVKCTSYLLPVCRIINSRCTPS